MKAKRGYQGKSHNEHKVDSVTFMSLAAPHRWYSISDFLEDNNGTWDNHTQFAGERPSVGDMMQSSTFERPDEALINKDDQTAINFDEEADRNGWSLQERIALWSARQLVQKAAKENNYGKIEEWLNVLRIRGTPPPIEKMSEWERSTFLLKAVKENPKSYARRFVEAFINGTPVPKFTKQKPKPKAKPYPKPVRRPLERFQPWNATEETTTPIYTERRATTYWCRMEYLNRDGSRAVGAWLPLDTEPMFRDIVNHRMWIQMFRSSTDSRNVIIRILDNNAGEVDRIEGPDGIGNIANLKELLNRQAWLKPKPETEPVEQCS